MAYIKNKWLLWLGWIVIWILFCTLTDWFHIMILPSIIVGGYVGFLISLAKE